MFRPSQQKLPKKLRRFLFSNRQNHQSRVIWAGAEAQSLGFHAEDLAIAVELPVEGSLSYEFGNVRKCLAASFTRVAVVSLRPKLLAQLAEAVLAALGAEAAAKVTYHMPAEFIAELRKLAHSVAAKPRPPLPPNTETIGNYEVESESPTLTPEERKQREDAAMRLIAETMRQAKRK